MRSLCCVSWRYGPLAMLCCGVLLLSGCMLGPDYERPDNPATDTAGYENAVSNELDPNELVSGPWWIGFGDDVIVALVDEALENNYDLKMADARITELEAVYTQSTGARLPSVGYSISRTRSKTPSYETITREVDVPGVGPTNLPVGSRPTSSIGTNWSHGISVQYVADIFGKLRRGQEAAYRDLMASESDRQAAIHAIVAAVVKARVNIGTLQRQLAVHEANTRNWKNSLEVVESRYQRGLASLFEVRMMRESLIASQQAETSVRKNLAIAMNSLDVVLGHKPGSGEMLEETLPKLPELDPVPVGLPSALLDRRPDLMASEMRLAGATSLVGVRMAQMYPDLSITGQFGYGSARFDDLLKNESEIYSLIMDMSAPLFMGGQLKAQVEAAKARVEQAALSYSKAILIAMREVEDALVNEQLLQEQLVYLDLQLVEAKGAEELVLSRYGKGLEKLMDVLEVQRNRRNIEVNVESVRGMLWSNRVDLYLALGGDWSTVELEDDVDAIQ